MNINEIMKGNNTVKQACSNKSQQSSQSHNGQIFVIMQVDGSSIGLVAISRIHLCNRERMHCNAGQEVHLPAQRGTDAGDSCMLLDQAEAPTYTDEEEMKTKATMRCMRQKRD